MKEYTLQQESIGDPIDAWLIAEPVLRLAELEEMLTDYSISVSEPHASVTNPHLQTAIIYRSTSPDISITEDCAYEKHTGLMVVEILVQHEPFPSILVGSGYLPNRSETNTEAYINEVADSIINTVNMGCKAGSPVIIMLDANCAFKRPFVMPPSKNSAVLSRILDTAGASYNNRLVVVNWAQTTSGFYTRTRAGAAPAQLDLALATSDIAHRLRLSILEDVNFDSDHCNLSLHLLSNTPLKHSTAPPRPKHLYEWDPVLLVPYHTHMITPLNTFKASIGRMLAAHPASQPTYKHSITFTKALASTIVTSYIATVPFKVHASVQRPPRPPGPSNIATSLMAKRQSARTAYFEAAAQQPCLETATAHLRATYESARADVRQHFGAAAHAKRRTHWEKMTDVYTTDKAKFFKEFSKMMEPPRRPLPLTLKIGKQELRKPEKIKHAWTERFRIDDENTGSAADEAERARITHLNDLRLRDRANENFAHNDPITEDEVGTQIQRCGMKKKAGDDCVLNDMLKRGSRLLLSCLTLLFNLLMMVERISTEWKCVPLEPMYKRGDLLLRANYRPIGYASNLYKLYERVLDVRIRMRIHLSCVQAGFRPIFGSITSLVRTKIIIDYCISKGVDLYVVYIDFKQAFERVWREGLLHRLWEMGVTGKLWRIVRDLLTNTSAFVRTNYGDGDAFPVDMGIIQGSVLAAILFNIFITHISPDLAHCAPIINNMRIPPLLFADDGNLFQIGEDKCKLIIEACLAWAAKWKMVVCQDKSKVMSIKNKTPPPLFADPKMFQICAHVVSLGVGIDNKGVYSQSYRKKILSRYVTKLQSIMRVGVRLGALRPDMGLYLFVSLAQSLLKYALPLTAPRSAAIQELQHEQERFAIDFLSLSDRVPPHAALAELGVLDLELQARKDMLLTYHRITNNNADTLTTKLMLWPLGPDQKTTIQQCEEELHYLLPLQTWVDFCRVPYALAKITIKQATLRQQEQRWAEMEANLGHLTSDARLSKPQWGLEPSLLRLPPMDVMTYISVRNGDALRPQHSAKNGLCAHCSTETQSTLHLLLGCPMLEALRHNFHKDMVTKAPQAASQYMKLPPKDSYHYLMGAGCKTTAPHQWETFQAAAVQYVCAAMALPS